MSGGKSGTHGVVFTHQGIRGWGISGYQVYWGHKNSGWRVKIEHIEITTILSRC